MVFGKFKDIIMVFGKFKDIIMVFGILKFVHLDINSHYGFTSEQQLSFFFFTQH